MCAALGSCRQNIVSSINVIFSSERTLYEPLCVCDSVYLAVYYLPVCVLRFRIVNKTCTEASLVPGIDELYNSNCWPDLQCISKEYKNSLLPIKTGFG